MSARVRSPANQENVPASKRMKIPLITAAVSAQRAMTQPATERVRNVRSGSFSNNSAMNINSGISENNATSNKKANSMTISARKNTEANARSVPTRSKQKRILGVTPGVGGTKRLVNVNNSAFLAAQAAANVKSTKAETVRRSTRVKPVNIPVPKTKARAKTPARAKTVKTVNNGPKNSDPKVEADAERVSNMFPKVKKLPVTKSAYAPILVKIIRATSIPAKFADLKDFLIYMYIQKSTNDRTRALFGGKTVKQVVRIIYKHYILFQKQSRGGDVLNLTIQLDKTNFVELAYLMYLDMKHDDIIDMSFDMFIKSDIIKTIFGSDYTKIDKNMNTKLYKNLLNLPNKGYESVIKENYKSLFNTGESVEFSNRQITADMFKSGVDTCLLFDQEDDASTLSNAQRRVSYPYSYVLDKIAKIGEIARTSETKPFYNTVSIANLVDPGHDMQMDSAKKDSQYVMKETPSTTLSWNYRKPVFKIGNTTLEYRLDDSTLNYVIDITNDKGKVTVPCGVTAPAARKATATVNDKISKFLGDFMQILTTVALNKTNTKSGYMYVLGTGDAMCAAMYSYICDITKTKNRLWFVKSKEQRSVLYGMNDVLDLSQLATNNNKLPIKSRTTGFF
jgi:hypothetical protein